MTLVVYHFSGGNREEARKARPLYFSTKLRPEGPKKFFSRPGPLLSQGLTPNKKHVGVYVCMYLWPPPTPPPLIWRSESATTFTLASRSLVWINGTQNSGLVSFARGSRLPFVQISSIYRKTTAKAWYCYQRWLWRNGTRISVWNIPSGKKTGLSFQMFPYFRTFSAGMTQKVLFHLLFNRVFQKPFCEW